MTCVGLNYSGNDLEGFRLDVILFQDGVVWHDIECRHKKPVICQESKELLDFALERRRG